MIFSTIILSAAFAASMVSAHMQLFSPPPFRAFNNPHTVGDPDIYIDFPHNCCGDITPMPCRGYLSLLGTPEGASVATWPAGSKQTWSITGPTPYGGNHYGGSCQVGFSVDKGKTFRTTVSYEGNCPQRHGGMNPSGQQFPFTVPSDLPAGDQIFAWTWINREREFFMNCAVVTITAGDYQRVLNSDEDTGLEKRLEPMLDVSMKHKRVPGDRTQRFVQRDAMIPFNQRPTMLFADVKNGCLSPLTNAELKYPNPGPNVVEGDGEYPLKLPTGNCTH